MKKIYTTLVMAMMIAFASQASIYIVGATPFGNWNPAVGTEMTETSSGVYTHTAHLTGTVWFVFADGLNSSWDVFNSTYRFGPLGGSDQTVNVDNWVTTQRQGNGNGAYKFTASISGDDYTITFDMNNMQFKIEGYVAPITETIYSVAGTPAALFGGAEWDQTNAATEMAKQADGTYAYTSQNVFLAEGTQIEFKVVVNHDWGEAYPASNYEYTMGETGNFDVTFTFNPETKEVGIEPTRVSELDPRTGELYIMGEVNGNGWAPNVGVKMDTEDGNVFTATVTVDGANEFSYFGFVTMLGENDWDWDAILPYRCGALENDAEVTEELMGTEIAMSSFGITNSFKIANGKYDIVVNLDNKTMVLTKSAGGDITGDVNGDGEVNIGDVNAVIDAILSGTLTAAADVNGDGEVNIGDVNAVIDIILTGK